MKSFLLILTLAIAGFAYAAPPVVEPIDTNIVNTPLSVRDLDRPTKMPVAEQSGNVTLGVDQKAILSQRIATVPDDKLLVIEHVSFFQQVLDGATPLPPGAQASLTLRTTANRVGVGGPFGIAHFLGTSSAVDSNDTLGENITHFSIPVRLYANPGTDVSFDIHRTWTVRPGIFRVTISGYLVDTE